MSEQPGVVVTGHALARLLERFPTEADGQTGTGLIFREVQEALAENRRSKRQPRWCITQKLGRQVTPRDTRHVWNEQETRCYVIVQREARNPQAAFKRSWVVLTTLSRMTEAEIAKQERLTEHAIASGLPRSKWKRGRNTRR